MSGSDQKASLLKPADDLSQRQSQIAATGPLPGTFPDQLRASGWTVERIPGVKVTAYRVVTPPRHVLATVAVLIAESNDGWRISIPELSKRRGDQEHGRARVVLARLSEAIRSLPAIRSPEELAALVAERLERTRDELHSKGAGPSRRWLPREKAYRGGLPGLGKRR